MSSSIKNFLFFLIIIINFTFTASASAEEDFLSPIDCWRVLPIEAEDFDFEDNYIMITFSPPDILNSLEIGTSWKFLLFKEEEEEEEELMVTKMTIIDDGNPIYIGPPI